MVVMMVVAAVVVMAMVAVTVAVGVGGRRWTLSCWRACRRSYGKRWRISTCRRRSFSEQLLLLRWTLKAADGYMLVIFSGSWFVVGCPWCALFMERSVCVIYIRMQGKAKERGGGKGGPRQGMA